MSADTEPWRYRCPRGHSNWRGGTGDRYYCQSCGEAFGELVDAKDLVDGAERSGPLSEDSHLEGVDDQTRRGVVALFDIEQTHLPRPLE